MDRDTPIEIAKEQMKTGDVADSVVCELLEIIESLINENESLRKEIDAWRNKPWAQQLRSQAFEISRLKSINKGFGSLYEGADSYRICINPKD